MVAHMLRRWIYGRLNRETRKGRARADGLRPRLERLEDRTLLSGSPLGVGQFVVAPLDMYVAKLIAEPNGQILAVGTAIESNGRGGEWGELAVARLNADGSLDATFGQGGLAVAPGVNNVLNVVAYDAILQPDGKVLVVGSGGSLGDAGVWGVVMQRFDASGAIDPTFGTGGTVLTMNRETPWAIALQTDGKIVVAGESNNPQQLGRTISGQPAPGTGHFTVARYDSDGSLDATFAQGGISYLYLQGGDEATAVSILPNGQILVGGLSSAPLQAPTAPPGQLAPMVIAAAPPADGVFVRYDADGSIDQSFGSGGLVETNFWQGLWGGPGTGSIVVSDGNLYAISYTDAGGLAMQHFNSDGALQTSGQAGQPLFNGPLQLNSGEVVLSDGTILHASSLYSPDEGGFLTGVFQPDGGYQGESTWAEQPSLRSEGSSAITLLPDGTVLLAATVYDASGAPTGPALALQLLRLDSASLEQAAPPPDAPSSGPPAPPTDKVNFQAFSNAIAGPNGTIFEAGYDQAHGTAVVARLHADGSLDPTFGVGGVVTLAGDYALTSLLPRTDGTMVVAGGSAQGFALWRLEPDGSLDPDFGLGGEVQVSSGDHAYWTVKATSQDDGGLVVTGFDGGPGPAPRVTLAQFHADGSLDAFLIPGLTMLTVVPDHSAAPVQGGPAVSAPSPAAAPSASPVLPPLTTNVTGDPAPAVTAYALPTQNGAVPPVPTGGAPGGTGDADPFGTERSGGAGDPVASDDQTTDASGLPAADAPVDNGAALHEADFARLLPGVDPAGPRAVLDYVFALAPLESAAGGRPGTEPVKPPAAFAHAPGLLALAPSAANVPAYGGAWSHRLGAFAAVGLGLFGATLVAVPADDAQRRRKRATAP